MRVVSSLGLNIFGGIHKGRPADPRGEGQKNRTKPDAGEGEGVVFKIFGRPKANNFLIFAFLILFV